MQRPGTMILRILLSAFFLATAATAAVVVKIYPEPISERSHEPAAADSLSPSAFSHLVTAKGEVGHLLLVPQYKIDSTNPFGETTFLTIRNDSVLSGEATVITFPAFGADPSQNLVFALEPRQIMPLNLSSLINQTPDGLGFQRGFIIVQTSGLVSADYFQVNTAQDFAAGSKTFNVGIDNEFCYRVRSRFLIGGGFSGGTELTIFVSDALGGDSAIDPPSVEGDAYDENGNFLNSFELYLEDNSIQIDASILVAPGVVGGAFEMIFPGGLINSLGGIVTSEYKANNKFSASFSSVCLEQDPPI